MKDHWKSFDYAAILAGLTAMIVFFFAGSGGTAEAVVCTVLGVAGLAYLGGALTMWFRCRIEFDLMLVKGSFLRRVVCLVVLLPFSMTFAVMLCGLGPEQMLPSADNAEEFGIFWSVFYHFIDPGNQHMTQNAAARGWTAVLAVFGIILLAGLLVSTLINWFDKRREQWYGGKIRYSAGQTGEDFAIVIGANEIVASVIRNLLAGESDDIDFRRERANRHVLLQTAGNPEELRDRLASQLPAGELDRVVIYNARRDSAEEIAALHPQLATEIYVLGENAGDDGGESPHDALNMKCVNLLAAELSKHSGAHRKVCKVLFEYQTTFSIFQFSDIPREVRDRLVFIPFNRYECWAQRVMVDGSYADLTFPGGAVSYTPLDGFGGLSSDSEEFVHFIVVGMSKMGVAMGIEAAFQAHYPNFRKARTRISFIASDADREMEFLKGRYHSLISVAAFNPEGRPVRAAQLDAHRIRYSYNPAGYVESIAYFGTGDEPVVSREGFHKVSNAYDTFGRIAEMSFYDVNGLPTENIYGFFRAENEYDDYGRHLGVSYYDTSGDLTVCRQPGCGYASYRNTYDKYGNLVESAAFGEEMEPVNADAGFSRMVSLYNENSQLLMIACYDKDGNLVPAPQSGGNAKSKSIYNADGYLEASIMFDPDNRITTSIYNTVDERGQLISTMMLDHTFGDLSRYDAITGEMEVFYANSYEDDAGKVRREEEYRHLMDSIETLAVDLYE